MALIKCDECGKEISENAKSCPHCGNVNYNYEIKKVEIVREKNGWSRAKMIIGIVSMVLFLIISLQSCAVGVSNTLSENESSTGSLGFMCALFMLIGGIVSVATKNSKGKGGNIIAIIFFWLAALLTIGTGTTYGDLPVWGSISFSFGLVCLGTILSTSNFFSDKNKQKILVIGVISLSLIAFIFGINSGNSDLNDNSITEKPIVNESKDNYNDSSNVKDEYNDNNNNNNNNNNSGNDYNQSKNTYTFNETFEFDDLNITIGSDYTFTTVSNKYSDYYNKAVIKLPITIKNISNETHGLNMFYYDIYGSQGTEVKDVNSYFDENVDYAGDLRSGAEYTKYLYIVYDGDGLYTIEFDKWDNKITVEFSIKK